MGRRRSDIGRLTRSAFLVRRRRLNLAKPQYLDYNEQVRVRARKLADQREERLKVVREKTRKERVTHSYQQHLNERHQLLGQIHMLNQNNHVSYHKIDFTLEPGIRYNTSCQFVQIGNMDKLCPHCTVIKFEETNEMYCKNETVKQPELKQPIEQKNMSNEIINDSNHFFENFRIPKHELPTEQQEHLSNEIAEDSKHFLESIRIPEFKQLIEKQKNMSNKITNDSNHFLENFRIPKLEQPTEQQEHLSNEIADDSKHFFENIRILESDQPSEQQEHLSNEIADNSKHSLNNISIPGSEQLAEQQKNMSNDIKNDSKHFFENFRMPKLEQPTEQQEHLSNEVVDDSKHFLENIIRCNMVSQLTSDPSDVLVKMEFFE